MCPKVLSMHVANERDFLKPSALHRKPLINAGEARKILGEESKELSDSQVEELVHNLTLLARYYLQIKGSKNKVGNNEQ